ncbi:MAG: DUF5076 domain-containing protein [Hyphomicrobiaceae bacterium]
MSKDGGSGPKLNELPIPAGVLDDRDAAEVLRAWVAHQGLHVALLPAFEAPEPWGMMLVDIARHAARALAAEKICSEAEALQRIRSMFDAEWGNATDEGSTAAHRKQ